MVGYHCPTCVVALNKQANGGLLCPKCNIKYPLVGGIPFLWSSPNGALLDWRNRFNLLKSDLAQQINLAASQEGVSTASQTRLQNLLAGLRAHDVELDALMAPLKIGEINPRETHLALKTRLASHHGVLSYAQNIFRDWCWGDDENEAVCTLLMASVNKAEIASQPSVLVLGAGAGRLAYDLHHALNAQATVALDSNPLLCLIGHHVAQGETLNFTEFPLAPKDAASVAVARSLKAPAPAAKGLEFLCADATKPPMGPAQLDLVVTPWLIDVIDIELAEFVRTIASLLKPDGMWLNHGSLAFGGADPKYRFAADEVVALAEANGFAVTDQQDVTLPYLQSPASRHGRMELTYTLVARRNRESVERVPHDRLPEWLIDDKLAIPVSDNFQSQITTVRIHAFIMSLIDGQRSIADMAKVLEAQNLMPQNQAKQAIRGFLTTMHEEAERLKR